MWVFVKVLQTFMCRLHPGKQSKCSTSLTCGVAFPRETGWRSTRMCCSISPKKRRWDVVSRRIATIPTAERLTQYSVILTVLFDFLRRSKQSSWERGTGKLWRTFWTTWPTWRTGPPGLKLSSICWTTLRLLRTRSCRVRWLPLFCSSSVVFICGGGKKLFCFDRHG